MDVHLHIDCIQSARSRRGGGVGSQWLRIALVAVAVVFASCKSSGGIPKNAKTTVLSFPDLDCAECGETLARDMIQAEGVHKTAFDKRRAELTVVADPKVDVLRLANQKKPADEDWHVVLGAGKGRYLPWEKAPQGADVKQVAKDGEDVPDLMMHVVKGKVTVMDFSAKWCEPCRKLDAHVVALVNVRSDIAYRKFDVGDWDTPLGVRYLKGIKELPYVLIFDKNGQQIEAMTGIDLERFDSAIAKASGEPQK